MTDYVAAAVGRLADEARKTNKLLERIAVALEKMAGVEK